jgi:hypothetical protein
MCKYPIQHFCEKILAQRRTEAEGGGARAQGDGPPVNGGEEVLPLWQLCCAWCCCLCNWADAMAIMDLTLATVAVFSGGQPRIATRSDRTAASGCPAPSAAHAARHASSATIAS